MKLIQRYSFESSRVFLLSFIVQIKSKFYLIKFYMKHSVFAYFCNFFVQKQFYYLFLHFIAGILKPPELRPFSVNIFVFFFIISESAIYILQYSTTLNLF